MKEAGCSRNDNSNETAGKRQAGQEGTEGNNKGRRVQRDARKRRP